MSSVKLPGGHSVNKKTLFIGLGGAALVGGYIVLKKRSAGSAPSTDQSSTDGTDPSLYDPNASLYGDSSGIDPYGSAGVGYAGGYYDPSTGQYIGGGVGSPFPPVINQVTTNAAWAQQCEAFLTQEGFNPVTVAAALGKYLTGGELTSAQEGIVQAAIALEGPPPQPVPPMHIGPTPNPHKPPPHRGPHKTHVITANGHETLWQIAHAHHESEGILVSQNLQLARYVGSKKNIPHGTRVRVYT